MKSIFLLISRCHAPNNAWYGDHYKASNLLITMGNAVTQPAKLDLNKKSFSKQKTIQNFTIDAQGFRKTKNENPPTWEMGVTS